MRPTKHLLPLCISLLVSAAVLPALAGGPDLPTAVTPGVYLGVGGSLNLEYMSVNTATSYLNVDSHEILVNANLKDKQIDGAPLAQLGYWGMIGNRGLWGLVGEYKYLNYTLNSVNGTNPIAFPNIAGLPGYGDLAVNIEHEFMLLLYFGATYRSGYFYLGLGPVLFTLKDSIRNYTNNIPPDGAEAARQLNFTTMAGSQTIWGGAAQLGYNYYFDPTWFIGANYTYTISANYNLQNQNNAWSYYYYDSSGAAAIGETNMKLARNYGFSIQEFMFSINKVFGV